MHLNLYLWVWIFLAHKLLGKKCIHNDWNIKKKSRPPSNCRFFFLNWSKNRTERIVKLISKIYHLCHPYAHVVVTLLGHKRIVSCYSCFVFGRHSHNINLFRRTPKQRNKHFRIKKTMVSKKNRSASKSNHFTTRLILKLFYITFRFGILVNKITHMGLRCTCELIL